MGVDGDRVLAFLKERIPSVPDDLLDDPGASVPDRLTHQELQMLIFAAQRAAPHLTREAFEAGFTAGDLVAWVAPALAAPQSGAGADRPPRGSYRSSSTTLRPVVPEDVDALYVASLEPQVAHRWRFRGRTPSPAEFHDRLFSPAVLAQFIVVDLETRSSVGLVTAYDADPYGGHCAVAFQRLATAADRASRGLMMEGVFVFVQYLFDHFDFRKVYFEVPEYNASLLATGAGSLLAEEGRLRGHLYYGDRTWDLITYALYRTEFESVADGFRGHWPPGHLDPEGARTAP